MSSEPVNNNEDGHHDASAALASRRRQTLRIKSQSNDLTKSSFSSSTFAQSGNMKTWGTNSAHVKTLRANKGIENPTSVEATDSTQLSSHGSLPSHLSRNLMMDPTAKSSDEVSIIRSKEEDEEDRKLQEKEKTLTWDDRQKMVVKANKVREEILATERHYLDSLNALDVAYLQKLNSRSLEDLGIQNSHREALVSNLTLLVNFHKQLNDELNKEGISRIEHVFLKYSPFFRMYTAYMNNYQKCLDTLQALHQTKKFQAFLQEVRAELLTKGNLDLMSYMIMPVQRVPRYVLLLKELKRNTVFSNVPGEQFVVINNALAMVMATAAHINESKRQIENMNTLIEIQHRIGGDINDLTLIQPYRRLVREGELYVTEPKKKNFFGTLKASPRIIFLFNDIILWTNKDMVFKAYINLAAARIQDIDETKFELSNSEHLLMIQCPDAASKTTWMNEINTLLAEQTEARKQKRNIRTSQKGHNVAHSLIVTNLNNVKTMKKNGREENGDIEESVSKNTSSILSTNNNTEPSTNQEHSTNSNPSSTSTTTTVPAPTTTGYKPRIISRGGAGAGGRLNLAEQLAGLQQKHNGEKKDGEEENKPE